MKNIFKHKKFGDYISTVLGAIVAIANAWTTIDWATFDIKRDYMKLILSGLIALGGWMTQLKMNGNKQDNQPN